MSEPFYFLLTFIIGAALGTLFFGGLWLTVKKMATSQMPALLFMGSFLIRVGCAMIGFYFISDGHWQRLLICMVGFTAARFLVMHLTKEKTSKQPL